MNAAQYFDHWNKVWRDLMNAVGMLKEDYLNFHPAEKYHRSVGDILRHIIHLEESWIHFVIRRQYPTWPAEKPEGLVTLKAIKDEMERVHKETMDYLSTVPVEDFNRIIQVPEDGNPKLSWILWHVLEQHLHHRGELFLCLSLLGLERPKTDRPG